MRTTKVTIFDKYWRRLVERVTTLVVYAVHGRENPLKRGSEGYMPGALNHNRLINTWLVKQGCGAVCLICQSPWEGLLAPA